MSGPTKVRSHLSIAPNLLAVEAAVPAASLARDTRATTGKRRFVLMRWRLAQTPYKFVFIRLPRWSTAKAGNPRFSVPFPGYFC